MSGMEQVSVLDLREDFSAVLRRVQAGAAFTVTDHGSPVALLVPVPAPSDDRLADLVAAGHVLPAARNVLPAPAEARMDRPSATEALLADRGADQR